MLERAGPASQLDFLETHPLIRSLDAYEAGSYTVPSNVTNIVSAAFEYSTGVTNVTMGTNVRSIGLFAFYDCPNLAAISVNSTNAFYSSTNGILFDKNKTTLIQYPIPIGGSYLVPATVV